MLKWQGLGFYTERSLLHRDFRKLQGGVRMSHSNAGRKKEVTIQNSPRSPGLPSIYSDF